MKIAAFGFAEDQTSKLSRILKLSRTHSYDLVEFDPTALPDLLLVFGEENLDGDPIQALPEGYQSRLVLVDRQRSSQTRRPQISYPLISSRVLQALDQVTSANEEFVETEAPATDEGDSYQKSVEADAPAAEEEDHCQQSVEAEAPAAEEEEDHCQQSVEAEAPAAEEEEDHCQKSIEAEAPASEEAAPYQKQVETEAPAAEKEEGHCQKSIEAEAPAAEEAAPYQKQVETEAPAAEEGVPYQGCAEAETAAVEPSAAQATEARSGYRVLVVDDSAPMQQALADELNSHFDQIEIDFADDGSIALERVDNAPYDFIFLDIMMPGIDGFETCTQMRKMPALKKTPIIMLSSKTSPLDEVKGIMAGSSTYLTKPIESAEFQKVVGRIRRWVDNFGTK